MTEYFHHRYMGNTLETTYDQDAEAEYVITTSEHHVRDGHLVRPDVKENVSDIQTMLATNENTLAVTEQEISEVRASTLNTMTRADALKYIVKKHAGKDIEVVDQLYSEKDQTFYMVLKETTKTEEEEA